MAGIPKQYKRQLKRSVKVSRQTGDAPKAPKKTWSFVVGDLVQNKSGDWGIVVKNPDDRGWMRVMSSGGEDDWHGSRTERVQKK